MACGGPGFKGVNVTVPHKEAAFALAHKVDGPARAAGAANLLIFREDGIEGRNTDALGPGGFLARIHRHAGGKKRRAAGRGRRGARRDLALEMLGAGKIHLLNRDAASRQNPRRFAVETGASAH